MDFNQIIDRRNTGSLKWNKYQNTDVIPFWVADMDFRSSDAVIDAMHQRLDHGVFGYTLAEQSCTEAVLEYMENRHNWKIEPEWLLWTPGLVPALTLACHAYGNPGDAVMTMTPVYYPFLTVPGYANQTLQDVPLVLNEVAEEWEIDFDALEQTVTDKTRLFILSNPHNPVGKVFSKNEMERLADFIVRHDLILCSDEIHCDLILNSKEHICAGTISEELNKRLIVMLAPSKTYNLAGLSCAYLVIPNKDVREKFQMAVRGIITEVNCLGYTACEAAYRHGEEWRVALIDYLEENRRYLYDYVGTHLPEIKLYPMDATYLAWLDVRKLKMNAPAAYFEKYGIGLSEGTGFKGKGFVRLNFGCSKDTLKEGLKRLTTGIEALR